MFAVHIVINEEGRKYKFESIQSHIDTITEISELLEHYEIKNEWIKSIEIVESSHWNGWKY